MAVIIGQIASLKALKTKLADHNLKQFTSVGSVIRFKETVSRQKEDILENHSDLVKKRLADLTNNINALDQRLQSLKSALEKSLTEEKRQIQSKLTSRYTNTNWLKKWLVILIYREDFKRFGVLQNNFDSEINQKLRPLLDEKKRYESQLSRIQLNFSDAVLSSAKSDLNELENINRIIDSLLPEAYGAIGERKVVDRISSLSDEFILINDFQLRFNPPLFYKKGNDRIFSIKLDHLLISQHGLFILETKNWSEKSVASMDLWSPVAQIQRGSYSLYRILNKAVAEGGLRLNAHHWGDRKISLKSIIVMINTKPNTEFQFVKILTIEELAGYITFLPQQYNSDEVKLIAKFLDKINYSSI